MITLPVNNCLHDLAYSMLAEHLNAKNSLISSTSQIITSKTQHSCDDMFGKPKNFFLGVTKDNRKRSFCVRNSYNLK